MPSQATARVTTLSHRTHVVGCGWFWLWALVGCAAALGTVSFGPLLSLPVAVLAVWLASRPKIRRSAFGLLTGAGALFLYVAYVNRKGPGTTCYHTQLASGCDSHLNPLPWLLIGVTMVVGGIIGHTYKARSH
jgi:hypothetical protein